MKNLTQMLKGGAVICALLGASAANAALIDFEDVATGNYTSLTFGDATLTYTGGDGQFDIVQGNNSTNAAISFFDNPGPDPFRLDFAQGASSVSVEVGDFNADQDNVFLELYDAFDNLLATTLGTNPAPSFTNITLSAAAPNAAYALFGDLEPFPGAVYWDNINWEAANPVPEPGTLALLGLGLAGLGLSRRRKTA